MMRIKRVVYLTNTDGLLDEKGNTVKGRVILGKEDKNYYRGFVKVDENSTSGTGGMLSKLNCALMVLGYNVEQSIITNAKSGLECLRTEINSTKFT